MMPNLRDTIAQIIYERDEEISRQMSNLMSQRYTEVPFDALDGWDKEDLYALTDKIVAAVEQAISL